MKRYELFGPVLHRLAFITVALLALIVLVGCPNPTGGSGGGDDSSDDGDAPPATFTVSYDGNGAESGTVPGDAVIEEGQDVTVAGNSGNLERTGNTFAGWNTEPDGSGTSYSQGAVYEPDMDVLLFAQWDPVMIPTVSLDSGSQVTYVDDTRADLIMSFTLSDWSESLSVTVRLEPDPFNVTSFSLTPSSLNVTQPVQYDTTYGVYAQVDDNPEQLVGEVVVGPLTDYAPSDTTAPAPPSSSLSAAPAYGAVALGWEDPSAADLASIEVTWTPGSGGPQSVAAGTEQLAVNGLTNGVEYTFQLVAIDENGNRSSGATVRATPEADAGDLEVVLDVNLENPIEIAWAGGASPISVGTNQSVELTVEQADGAALPGSGLSITWRVNGAEFAAVADQAMYTWPGRSNAGTVTVSVAVTNGEWVTSLDKIITASE